MSWLWKSNPQSKSPQLPVSYAHQRRTKQIESLRDGVNGVVEDARDVQYHVSFVAGSADLQLHIFLPPGFPKDPPELKITPLCAHHWVDQDGAVNDCPALLNYSIHESLGKVIRQIIDELKASPPIVLGGSGQCPTSTPYPINQPYQPYHHHHHHQQQQPSGDSSLNNHTSSTPYPISSSFPTPHSFPQGPSLSTSHPSTFNNFQPRRLPPPVPGAKLYHASPAPLEFPELNSKTESELKEYLDDIEGAILINQMLESHPVMEKLRKDREDILARIEKQTEMNLSREPDLMQNWDSVQSRHLELNEWTSRFSALSQKQNKLSKRHTPSSVAAKLDSLSIQSETDSDVLGEEFLEKKIDITKFMKQFSEERKLYYLRQAKAKMLQSSSNRSFK